MRVALIEVGHWHAARHLRSLQRAGADIVAVSDRQPGVAEATAAKIGCLAFRDYRDMLKAVKPDFVMAMGRHADMPAIARDLLEARIPFAIEKPLGTSAEQVAPLVDLAYQRNAFVAIPFTNRYSALWTHLDRLEKEGRVGPRCHAHFRIINGPPSRYEADRVEWMLDPAISGGGCMRNLGIHAADAFLYFAGRDEVRVLGAVTTRRVHGKAVEEMGAAILCSQNGVIGTIEAGYSYASMTAGDFEWRVATANCYLVDRNDILQVATLDDAQIRRLPNDDQETRYDRFGVDTIERLRLGKPPRATIEDCYRAMRIIDEIYSSATNIPRQQ